MTEPEDAGLDVNVLSDYKRKVLGLAEKSIGLTVAFIGFTFPLILVDAYMGLGSDSLLILGAMGAATFLLIYAVVLYFLNASFLKKDVYSLSEKEAAVYRCNHKLKRTYAIILVILLVATFVCHQFATSIWGPYSIMKGTTFDNYDSFIDYMEQHHNFNNGTEAVEIPVPSEEIETGTYYDEYGNEISEEALTRRLEDKNDNVVCEYIDRNENVVSLRYTPKDGTILPLPCLFQLVIISFIPVCRPPADCPSFTISMIFMPLSNFIWLLPTIEINVSLQLFH